MTVQLERHHHVHFVGIAGIGMSALARLLLARGFRVTGSDRDPGEQGVAMGAMGITVYTGHSGHHSAGADLVVISSAVGQDNVEIVEARSRGVPVIKRAELLGTIMNAGRGVAVAGTHGKTTTSALIGHILTEGGLDPTILIGGMSANLGSNARIGGDLVVVEADEYDASFLQLKPAIGVITNVEPDHLDFYGTVEHLHCAFGDFARSVREDLVYCADDAALPALVGDLPNTLGYGIGKGDWHAGSIEDRNGRMTFQVEHGSTTQAYSTRLAGSHNVQNCLAAIAVATLLGMNPDEISRGLETFAGVQRRFEIKGESGGVLVMDDYAHHPTEVAVNLAAIKQRYGRPIRLIFQPHTYSRTKSLLEDFSDCFENADVLYLMDIYAARETDTLGISGRDLAEAVMARRGDVRYVPSADDVVEDVLRDVRPGDLVVTMGAGDVYRAGNSILEALPIS